MNHMSIDLTSEEDDILFVKKKFTDNSEIYSPNFVQSNNDISTYFYGTEDLSQQYLSIQHPLNRKVLKTQYSIKCPKCHELFNNCNFFNHIIDHYKLERYSMDQLCVPQISTLLNTLFNDVTTPVCNNKFRCEICFMDFDNPISLGQHLDVKHVCQDMPYVCFVCNFYRTSFLSQLKQHFYDYHKSTEHVICPFCIQPFELSLVSNNCSILDPTSFVVHIEKHLVKKQFSCDKCVLKFTTKLSLIFHKTVYHEGRELSIENDGSSDRGLAGGKIVKKSLNVTNQPIDVSKLTVNCHKLVMACAECRENLTNVSQHYHLFNMCTQCGFRSYCAAAFRKHLKTVHGLWDVAHYKSIDIYHRGVLICECGYQTMHGDAMASHLYRCQYKSCFLRHRVDNSDGQIVPAVNPLRPHALFAALNLHKIDSSSGMQ